MKDWRAGDFKEMRGLNSIATETQQLIYKMLIKNNISSCDGRNGCIIINIRKQKYFLNYRKLDYEGVIIEEKQINKEKIMFQLTE